ncbi:cocaine- and amphetamine-regulated transcript protein [Falco biarmicus]|uniref:Cocaine- and amphetamine-regulated transcript protein n=1 Tax=Aquila chrysaetos chrysaetos TaxID=223781 RepID=A0A663F328_AQUCH|nr:cocaine- and amphetamine-regulated transcript protein [Aquila chrysaetos chrysaetos]XP_040435847.1 cocaine- and amphetamine-regulated transcript protein isoform X2 [Falco naumanni]XP_055555542.1 cocaine- and amphetamine-regulated transcript protein [Falco cherrug]XP_055647314.1 cocaine- and amphetamine-regulated transcript protein [Falco peregrinus]XP_056181261.1 cocaine- and amphetamine-regulated transcript protein [Falco biarmicus]
MESCRALALCAVAAALLLGARGQGPTPPRRARDLGPPGGGGASREKELIEALQEVLEKLKSKRVPHYEKKFGQVPMCDAGEQCAVRKGARIGKLCDCPRGTSCNSFLLKCL